MTTIRAISVAEAARVMTWAEALGLLPERYPEEPIDGGYIAETWRGIIGAGQGQVLVAEIAGVYVGTLAWAYGLKSFNPTRGIDVHWWAVASPNRGRGVGAALLQAVVGIAEAVGMDLVIDVPSSVRRLPGFTASSISYLRRYVDHE